MFCPNCGTFAEDGTAFCQECGAKLTPAAETVAAGGATPPENVNPAPSQPPVDYPTQTPVDYPMQTPVVPPVETQPLNNNAVFGQQPAQPTFTNDNNQPAAQQFNPQFNQGMNQFNQPVQPVAPKKKSKGCLIAAIIVGALLVLFAVLIGVGVSKVVKSDEFQELLTTTEEAVSVDDDTDADDDDGSGVYLSDYFSGDYTDLTADKIEKGVNAALKDVMLNLDMYAEDEISVESEVIKSGSDSSGEYIAFLLKSTIECEENDDYYEMTEEEYVIVAITASENKLQSAEYLFSDYDSPEEALADAEADYDYWLE